jgi:acetyltransferase-like isoleucine patch superfamily enzyme
MRYRQLLLSPTTLYAFIKKTRNERANKEKFLKLGLNVVLDNCEFGVHNYINTGVSLKNSSLGDYSYVNANSTLTNCTVGKFCSIGSNVMIGLGKHPISFISTHPSFYSNNKEFKTFADKMYYKEYEKTNIGNDVWIGGNVMIMSGLTIGNGAVIAAGSIVTKDVLPYSIVGGVPAKHIKYRFSEDVIEKLQASQWWNKDLNWIINNYKSFLDVNAFLELIQQQ